MRILLLKLLCVLLTFSTFIPAEAQQVTVRLWPAGDTNHRWKDIAGNLYSQSYIDHEFPFPYDQANVRLTYHKTSDSFRGKLRISGLKPNFSYQMKLEGIPSVDEWANQQIGNIGRWWSNIGYVFFDFITTDRNGSASRNFILNSSYHVLWNTHLNSRTPRSNDSGTRNYVVTGDSTDDAYDTTIEPITVGIYAEWESGRPVPGTVQLPDGRYKATFRLTEESFHKNGEYEGGWASVMEFYGLEFEINNLIPVELAEFSAQYIPDAVLLNWRTLSETNNLGYHIYRFSNHDPEERRITSKLIRGAGTTFTNHDYDYRDTTVEPGKVYFYRLADIDMNGKITYHEPIRIETIIDAPIISLHCCYPNPFNNLTSITFSVLSPCTVDISVYDIQGKRVRSFTRQVVTTGMHHQHWDGNGSAGRSLTSGLYLISVSAVNVRFYQKVMLIK